VGASARLPVGLNDVPLRRVWRAPGRTGKEKRKRIRVSDRTRLQKLFISANTPFTRGFPAKIPVCEGCAAGVISGDFGQLWVVLGFSGLFLHKYAVYKGFLALKFSFTVNISCKRFLSNTRIELSTIPY